MTIEINDTVRYVPGKYSRPDGSCQFDWAEEYCLEEQVYKVIDVKKEEGDIRIKGRLNPAAQPGKIPDEIWVNAIQFTKID